jgi:hypothetical protein
MNAFARKGLFALAAVSVPVAYTLAVRPWHLRWGATDEECMRPLPGDAIVPDGTQSTRAITIHAPARAIWPWLVQMGQNRAGFYSFDWLERLAGADIHNADQIVPLWQHLAVGDLMRTYRYIERYEPLGWIVVAIEPERALVLRSADSRWSWALALDPLATGGTRLIARTRDGMMPGLQAPLKFLVAEPAHCIMEIGVLRGIKARAERMARSSDETATISQAA